MLDYRRDTQEWDLKYSSSGKTHKIYVWKRTTTAVYFHIVTSETTPKHIFLKVSTTANSALMREVQTDGCANGVYESTVNSSTVTMKKDDILFTTHSSVAKYKFFKTWTFSSSQPGFFGFLKYTLKKQYYDNNGNTVATPAVENDTYTVTAVSAPTVQSSDSYTSIDYPNRYYCLVNDFTTQHIDIVEAGVTADSNLLCDNSGDAPTVTVGTETFTPATELIAPL